MADKGPQVCLVLSISNNWVMSSILIKVHTTMQRSRTKPSLEPAKKLLKLFMNPWIRRLTPTVFKKTIAADGSISGPFRICLQGSTRMSFGLITPKLVFLQSSIKKFFCLIYLPENSILRTISSISKEFCFSFLKTRKLSLLIHGQEN